MRKYFFRFLLLLLPLLSFYVASMPEMSVRSSVHILDIILFYGFYFQFVRFGLPALVLSSVSITPKGFECRSGFLAFSSVVFVFSLTISALFIFFDKIELSFLYFYVVVSSFSELFKLRGNVNLYVLFQAPFSHLLSWLVFILDESELFFINILFFVIVLFFSFCFVSRSTILDKSNFPSHSSLWKSVVLSYVENFNSWRDVVLIRYILGVESASSFAFYSRLGQGFMFFINTKILYLYKDIKKYLSGDIKFSSSVDLISTYLGLKIYLSFPVIVLLSFSVLMIFHYEFSVTLFFASVVICASNLYKIGFYHISLVSGDVSRYVSFSSVMSLLLCVLMFVFDSLILADRYLIILLYSLCFFALSIYFKSFFLRDGD